MGCGPAIIISCRRTCAGPKTEGIPMQDPTGFYTTQLADRPALQGCISALVSAHQQLVTCFQSGGKLLICGNGGSWADSVHIAGELMKRFAIERQPGEEARALLGDWPDADVLLKELEPALPVVALGCQGSLWTASMNDRDEARIVFAQECYALGQSGDVLLGISTSGNATDVIMAMGAARLKGMHLLSLTGPDGGTMATRADVAIRAPGESVPAIQENHMPLYHALCLGIERHFFAAD